MYLVNSYAFLSIKNIFNIFCDNKYVLNMFNKYLRINIVNIV